MSHRAIHRAPSASSSRVLHAAWWGAGALVVALTLFATSPARAQALCTAGAFTNSRAEAPLLDAFTPLFRQNGVSFLARVETDSATAGGRLVIRNGNAYDVELTYDVVVTGSAGPVSAEGRCVRIRAGEYAVDADAGTVFRYEGGTPTAVRVRNLRMARIVAEGGALATADAPAAAPSDLAQYRCGSGGAPGQRACSTAFMAAAARAAAETGNFSGTSRECLLEYAGQQDAAARLIRASDPRGDSLRLATPSCYSRGEARWGYEALATVCPRGEWTAANAGQARCSAAADSVVRDSAAVLDAAESARQRLAAGVVLLNEGRAAEAEAEFRAALALSPADAVIHASLGSALARQNRMADAEAAYRAAVWLDPTNVTFVALLRGLRPAPGASTAHQAALRHAAVASAAPVLPTAPSRVPMIIATVLRLVFATALTALGALLLFPVLSALYLAVVWGGSRMLGVRG